MNVAATRTMIKRAEQTKGLQAQTACGRHGRRGTGKFLDWLVGTGVTPHIPVKAHEPYAMMEAFSSSDFTFDHERSVYVCPTSKLLRTTGNARRQTTRSFAIGHRDATAAYAHSSRNAVRTRPRARSNATSMSDARDYARSFVGTPEFDRSRNERRKVADAICAPERPIIVSSACALRGSPARATSFTSPAIVQNLKTLALRTFEPPPDQRRIAFCLPGNYKYSSRVCIEDAANPAAANPNSRLTSAAPNRPKAAKIQTDDLLFQHYLTRPRHQFWRSKTI